MHDHHHEHGHQHGGQHSDQGGNDKQNPSVMVDRFGKMPLHDANLFVIRRLKASNSPANRPTPLIRSAIHSFIFITEGETLITIGEEKYLFKANECAVIPAGQLFSVHYYDNCTGYMGGFHTDFLSSPELGMNPISSFQSLRQWGDHKVLFDGPHSSYIGNIFERLLVENQWQANKKIIRTYLITLLIEIDEASRKGAMDGGELNISNQICNKFVEKVFAKHDMSFTVVQYAQSLNISAAHLHKIVKRLTNKTPSGWITEAIILESKAMLANNILSVSEIASRLGILDPSYFSRLFKKQVGMSPVAFRNLSKNP